MNNLQFQQLSPVDTSYPQFQSTPTYDCQPHPDKTSPSQLPQYFTLEDNWRQPTPSNSPPGSFLLPSDKQCCPGGDTFPELDQIQLLPPPPNHQYNSLSSEDDSSYQQFDTTPPPHYQYNSLSSEDDSSYQQFDNTPPLHYQYNSLSSEAGSSYQQFDNTPSPHYQYNSLSSEDDSSYQQFDNTPSPHYQYNSLSSEDDSSYQQFDTTPPPHYQYNSLSSEDDSSYQQFDNTPTMSVPLFTPFYLPDIDTNSLQFLTSQDHNLLGLDPIFFTQDIPIPDLTPPSSPEPDMLSFIAENSALIAAREMFSDGLFNEVLDFISSSDQPERLHEEFQELWTETIYRQASAQRRGKVLNAVDRYRLRKRKPFPRTIWNGDQSRHLFKESSRSLLQEYFDKNPYPTPEEKRDLTSKSQLSYSQVSNFFKNRRGRQRGSGNIIPAKRRSAESSEDAKNILEMLQR